LSQYLTLNEVTQLLGVSSRTVRRYTDKGLLTREKDGRKSIFRKHEVLALAETKKHKGPMGVLYDRVAALTARMSTLEVRVKVLEFTLSSRQPDVNLDGADIKAVRRAITEASKSKAYAYPEIKAWADDLLRLDKATCAKIGYKKLGALSARLITSGESLPEVLGDPTRMLSIDKLRLFVSRLRGFSSTG
jgi:excisionase family DNA binding protein